MTTDSRKGDATDQRVEDVIGTTRRQEEPVKLANISASQILYAGMADAALGVLGGSSNPAHQGRESAPKMAPRRLMLGGGLPGYDDDLAFRVRDGRVRLLVGGRLRVRIHTAALLCTRSVHHVGVCVSVSVGAGVGVGVGVGVGTDSGTGTGTSTDDATDADADVQTGLIIGHVLSSQGIDRISNLL